MKGNNSVQTRKKGGSAIFAVRSVLPIMLMLLAFSAGSELAAQTHHAAKPEEAADSSRITFLDSLEHKTFNFFWETTNRQNGLTPDRFPTKTFSSVAAVGFALTAYPIGVERGYITREQAVRRVLTTLKFFLNAKMGPDRTRVTGYKGFY
ncbi:MAG TPA: hypothetical protein PL001_10275, partial [Candidatus Kryptobacter bacterium]|nr:hypothetical protein [Candidatus Kryptobacter bacterium]